VIFGKEAFIWQFTLKEISIPDSVIWIEDSAFQNENLPYVPDNIEMKLGCNVVSIGDNAFDGFSIGHAGSTAAMYASEFGHKFSVIK